MEPSRMTPEQAANHPSKNVISHALGAEEFEQHLQRAGIVD